MKQDLRSIIQKVAQFLDIDLIKENQLLDRDETYASFDYMKKNFDSSRNAFLAQHGQASDHSMRFIRKGIVGDWSSWMTDEQRQRLDAITIEKTRDMPGLEAF